MRTKSISKGLAVGPSQWIVLDSDQDAFSIGFLVTVQQGSNLTYKVQGGFCDQANDRQDTDNITRVATTATVVFGAAHGMATGDVLVVQGAGAPLDGTFDVTVSNSTTVTYTVPNSGVTQAGFGCRVWKIHVTDHPVVTAQTTSQAGNYAFPLNLMRVNLTAWVSGQVDLTVAQGS